MPLVPHLCDDIRIPRGLLRQESHLVDGVAKRFLGIDVLAVPDGGHRNSETGVVGRRDHHRVDLLAKLVEHHAVVLPELDPVELLLVGDGCLVPGFMDIAERDNVVGPGQAPGDPRSAAPHTYAGDVELAVRGGAGLEDVERSHDRHGRGQGAFEKCATLQGHTRFHDESFTGRSCYIVSANWQTPSSVLYWGSPCPANLQLA